MSFQRLGNYELIRRLATGGMGEVYLARSAGTDGVFKQVVVKRIFPHFRDNPEYRRLFVREAKVTSRLVHPNVAQVIDLGEHDNELYLVMEYVPGCDLAVLIKQAGRAGQGLPPDVLAVVAYDLLDALDHAHTALDASGQPLGVIHHDVSPQNVLVSVDGFCKLCDFGIARFAQDNATNHAAIRGKFAYAAPEQLAGRRVDARADLFSLGVVLYEGLTGTRMYEVGTLAERQERDRATSTTLELMAPTHERELVLMIAKLLHKDAEGRYASAAQARDALEPVLLRLRPIAARQSLAQLTRANARPEVDPEANYPGTQVSKNWRSLIDRSPIETPQRLDPTVIRDRPSRPEIPAYDPDDTALRTPPVITPITGARAAPRPKGQLRTILVSVSALLAAGLVGLVIGRSASPPVAPLPTTATIDSGPAPRPREVVIEPPPSGLPASSPAPLPSPAPAPAPVVPRPPASAPPPVLTPSTSDTEATSARARKDSRGYLTINAVPWAYVSIDGVRLPKATPLRRHPLPAGRHVVELVGPSGETRRFNVEVRAGATTTEVVRFDEAAAPAPAP